MIVNKEINPPLLVPSEKSLGTFLKMSNFRTLLLRLIILFYIKHPTTKVAIQTSKYHVKSKEDKNQPPLCPPPPVTPTHGEETFLQLQSKQIASFAYQNHNLHLKNEELEDALAKP